MTQSYYELLGQRGAEPRLQGVWASVGASAAAFGWKLHLSSVQTEALALLETVLPTLLEASVPFKVARDATILAMLNEGGLGTTQVGKFMTIYPPSPAASALMARELIAITGGFAGPRIVTDLQLGGVVYTRYGSFSPAFVRDRLGNLAPFDPGEHGAYKVPFVAPEGVENPFSAYVQGRQPQRSPTGPIGPGYLLLRPLTMHAKGSVYLALDLRRQEDVALVILKEGRRHCMSDEHGRDMWDRLRHQQAVHQALAGRSPIPAAGPLFEGGENLYLPIAHVEGRDLGERPQLPFETLAPPERRALLAELQGLVGALRALHRAGYVHRDLAPRNVRLTQDGQVYLLDLELSHHIDDRLRPPFMQGTLGFISPQQAAGAAPTTADDIYALGALMASTLTGLPPQRVLFAQAEGRGARLRSLSGAPAGLCRLIEACVHDKPARRPDLGVVDRTLADTSARLGKVARRRGGSPAPPARSSELAAAALGWIVHDSFRDPAHGLWLSPELEASQHDATLRLPHTYRLYRSTSRGVAGVVYSIARLKQMGIAAPGAVEQVGRAVDWLLSHEATPDDQMPGLHFGEAGVAVAIAEAIAAGLLAPGPWLLPYMHEALAGLLDWPDLTHGAAGQGIAALLCAHLLDRPELAAHAHQCAEYLLDHQAADGSWSLPDGVEGLSGTTYTGFAHGVAGIVYFLAAYTRHFRAELAAAAVVRGGAWLLEQAHPAEGARSLWWPIERGGTRAWSWWCHGAPGIALAFLALFQLTGDSSYAETARAALRGLDPDQRHANLSQCHGLSGLGEILLEASQVLGEDEWSARAARLALSLEALARREAGGACWLVENPFQPTADLMIGCGGVAHFLARLAQAPELSYGMPLLI